MGSTTATQHLYRTAFAAPSFQFFLLLYEYNIGGILSGHGVCTCMKERKVHIIGAGGLHQIKKHRAAKFCADGLPNSGHTGLLYEHSTVLYAYIWALGVKNKRLPLNVK